ncbi:hypothetical protein H8A99_26425 [Bradyrhizobium sp. Arg68]|uniref:hypothetical protein n=1 Tax=Bradyrhizobium ivorense TaxID=2511166 RepID=UPI001E4BF57C|nr:hypothetical protein [Bradyrhizobium ivorense]MCC8939904.1 hypothetical protein [Bradyrhizobium ivorense]
MSTVRACRGRQVSRKASFLRDQRGAVAFEMPFVYVFLIMVLLLPLADLAMAGFSFVSAWESLRAFGQSIQYDPPSDLGNSATWKSTAIGKADSRYPISNFRLICGDADADCSGTNTASPKYYSYSTSITLAPMVLTTLLCDPSCTYTLSYSERFQ